MDARFSDADEKPLRLRALDAEDLEVTSALLQDAAGRSGDLVWMKGRRRFALFLNRFRWEDAARAQRAGRPFERVRTVILIDHVEDVKASGVDPRAPEQAISVLRLEFRPSGDPDDPSGVLRAVLAGDGEVAISVECLEVRLEDVTRPYAAPAGRAPSHPLDD
ncbi:MAG TPA: DUF2948 family protein [Paracoccaceae bacterium]|nr:DUF2948 family protein [Paracoccaceae bacterium]